MYPFRIRLGGTLQDHIIYDVGLNPGQSCLPIVKDETYMFGFREGCLSMERWIALNTFFAKTGYDDAQLFRRLLALVICINNTSSILEKYDVTAAFPQP